MLLQHRNQVRSRVASLQDNLTAIDAKINRHRRILRQQGAVMPEISFSLGLMHHVQLAIPRGGEDACRDFWNGVLGMQELAKPPILAARGGCWFRGG